jgi:hypothetical protein
MCVCARATTIAIYAGVYIMKMSQLLYIAEFADVGIYREYLYAHIFENHSLVYPREDSITRLCIPREVHCPTKISKSIHLIYIRMKHTGISQSYIHGSCRTCYC